MIEPDKNYMVLSWWALIFGLLFVFLGVFGFHLFLDAESGGWATMTEMTGLTLASIALIVGFWLCTLGVRYHLLDGARERRLKAEAERLQDLGSLGEK